LHLFIINFLIEKQTISRKMTKEESKPKIAILAANPDPMTSQPMINQMNSVDITNYPKRKNRKFRHEIIREEQEETPLSGRYNLQTQNSSYSQCRTEVPNTTMKEELFKKIFGKNFETGLLNANLNSLSMQI
jgi:hypothetical protein